MKQVSEIVCTARGGFFEPVTFVEPADRRFGKVLKRKRSVCIAHINHFAGCIDAIAPSMCSLSRTRRALSFGGRRRIKTAPGVKWMHGKWSLDNGTEFCTRTHLRPLTCGHPIDTQDKSHRHDRSHDFAYRLSVLPAVQRRTEVAALCSVYIRNNPDSLWVTV